MNLSGREKATIFLSILGSETASRILRYLPEELADVIATSVNHLPTPTPDALGQVLTEFKGALSLSPGQSATALGQPEEREVAVLTGTPIEKLNAASAKKIAYIFSFERPQVIAFVLSRLNNQKKDEVLENLGPQKDIVFDLLKSIKSTKFSPKIESELLEIFSKKV